jgi:hypothetical protein
MRGPPKVSIGEPVFSRLQLCPPAASRRPGLSGNTTTPAFIVRDYNGQALAYIYFEDERGRLQHDGDERG